MSSDPNSAGWIHAFKPVDSDGPPGEITSCELDDPDATIFRVHWRGSTYSGTFIDCDSRHRAEWLVIAINDAFKAGKRRAMYELRMLIGVAAGRE